MDNLFLKKLKIKPNYVIKMVDAPQNASTIFGTPTDNVALSFGEEPKFDVLITFSITKLQLNAQIESNLGCINSRTIFWVFYPKKSSQIESDLDLMKSWNELSGFGLAPCASASVDEIWTALRLKLITDIKPSGLRNDHIRINSYGKYIDPEKKVITLPLELEKNLNKNSTAIGFFFSLSYTNRKEYVIWILSAKRQATKLMRMDWMMDMLLAGKKNPTEK